LKSTCINLLLLIAVSLIIWSCNNPCIDKSFHNLSFEKFDSTNTLVGWKIKYGMESYVRCNRTNIDSNNHIDNKYSLAFDLINNKSRSVFCRNNIPNIFKGSKIELYGYIKAEKNTEGVYGLTMMLEAASGTPISKLSSGGYIAEHGRDKNWKLYKVELTLDPNTQNIGIGAYFNGVGKIYLDSFSVLIDGVPVDSLIEKEKSINQVMVVGIENNIKLGEDIEFDKTDSFQVENLVALCNLWGFVKYYSPSSLKNNINRDSELLSLIPKIINVKYIRDRNKILEQSFVPFRFQDIKADCQNCQETKSELFGNIKLSTNINAYLCHLIEHFHSINSNYVMLLPTIQNPIFNDEIEYSDKTCPSATVRILALFRYYNIVKYFYVNKDLADGGWDDDILREFVPKFFDAKDHKKYLLTCLELISRINDTHAVILDNTLLDTIKGIYMSPFKAEFVEKKLIVTDYYTDNKNVTDKVLIGDIIHRIDGIAVDSLVSKYKKYTPSSNYPTMLRNIASSSGFLLRSERDKIRIDIERNRYRMELLLPRMPISQIAPSVDYINKTKTPFRQIETNILYIYAGLLKESDIDSLKTIGNKYKMIIVDLRCTPSAFIPYSFGEWLKNSISPFAKLSTIDINSIGKFKFVQTLENGMNKNTNINRRVAIVVNEHTQSEAEFTAMALQTIPGSKTIGSMTAGADGDVSGICLPGGIRTRISGIGIYYPNGERTQCKGIKIDFFMKPTIKGIVTGRDDLLDRAIKYVKNGR